ncbi:MAG: hypothetical protein A2V66_03845 [Ignavibacteria bacterium RBG_13_36_8]|nr:MAG: hypothetical protein A2V66_03845 [Ignavibacteria bacterium RBG_13_36_8]
MKFFRYFILSIVPLFFLTATYTNTRGQDFNCLDCHENLIQKSVHNEIIECGDCHTDITDEEHIENGGQKVNCGICHTENADLQKTDIHHRLKVGNRAPDCKTCHGTHEIKSPSESTNIVKDYCSKCHTNIVYTNPFHSKAVSKNICAECHNIEEHQTPLNQSVHSKLNCADCHNHIANNLSTHPEGNGLKQAADCYLCHSKIAAEHRESIHGISLREGINEAAQCWDCHGSHDILQVQNEKNKVFPSNLAATCGRCHDDPNFVQKFSMSIKSPGHSYSLSVHGKLVEAGKLDAATCVTCHGVHDIKNRIMPGSRISSFNVPNTCIHCHKEVTEEYKKSIHWIQAKKGVKEAPVCNDCHSEHDIVAINTIQKKEEIRKIQEETCFKCHQDPIIAIRYGLIGNEARNYQDSYHGLAVMRGDTDAALCIDCHGVHKILPKNYPESTVYKSNIITTCQKCHLDATELFAKSYSHISQTASAKNIEDFVKSLYFWLIIIVIGGMVLHNALIFIYEIRKKRKKGKNEITIPRFTKNEVVQHITLLTSFITLAITGFALKYPVSWWAEGLQIFGMSETVRQNIHRIAAIVMIVLSFYHVLYLIVTRRGRDVLLNLIPKLDDARQAVDNILYYLRINKSKPEFDKYDYTEKAEYWALVWGTVVMGITGFILWFPTIVGEWAPVWLIKVSEIVHFYEAILATLAILVWHWFFVIFHPREYPMSFVWIDGKMSLDSYRHHHERHFKKIILQWYKMKSGNMQRKDLKYSTELFLSTFEKHGLNPDEVIQTELNKDPKLRVWLEQEIEGTKSELN